MKKFLFLSALVPLFCFMVLAQGSEYLNGTVTVDGQLMFNTRSAITSQGNAVERRTEYYDLKDTRFLLIDAKYNLKPLSIVSMELNDSRTGRMESIKREGRGFRVQNRSMGNAKLETELIEDSKDDVILISYMIMPFIQQNLAKLEKGSDVEFDLIVPSRLETVGFDLVYEGLSSRGTTACHKIKMEAGSWFIRQLVDPLYFYVEKEAPHRLIEFKGRLSPTDEKGEALTGTIRYRYQ